jgi:hypothetical protein
MQKKGKTIRNTRNILNGRDTIFQFTDLGEKLVKQSRWYLAINK